MYQVNTQDCGLEGQLDAGMSQYYQTLICKKQFYSSNYISSQFHIQAWVSMEAGDSVSIELWRSSGNISRPMESVHWDIANGNPSPAPGQWSNLSWDPQVTWA